MAFDCRGREVFEGFDYGSASGGENLLVRDWDLQIAGELYDAKQSRIIPVDIDGDH